MNAPTHRALLALSFALAACGTSAPAPTTADAAATDRGDVFALDLPDGGLDPVDAPALPDVATDLPIDISPGDAALDASADAAPDVTPDTPAPDAAAADASPDASTCMGSVCSGACVNHREAPTVCGTATLLGRWCGDANCNAPLCRATMYRAVATRMGRSSEWFRASSVECSLCTGNLLTRITLAVPAGVDYDLFVHRPCGTVVASSIRGAGVADQVELDVPDRAASDDGFDYFIEVRHISGASCEPFVLTVEARGADATNC